MKYSHILAATVIAAAVAHTAEAQGRIRVETPRRRAEQLLESRTLTQMSDRPQLGIAVTSSGAGDTLGVLVDDVTKEGPAERAGVKEGDRIQSINGMSLRLSAADAAADDMEGVAARRLIRELEKMKVGDEASLAIYRDGRTMSLKVATASAADLSPARSALRRLDSDRAVIGLGLGASGSRRDTAGVLIMSVVDDGPADKAGIEEGDRIAAINGVDLRVPREDAGDAQVSNARLRRFYKEIEDLKAGGSVELRLVRGGQSRTVKVMAVAASELPQRSGFSFSIGEGDGLPLLWFGGDGDTRSFSFPRSEGGVRFFDRDGEENGFRGFSLPRGGGDGVFFFDRNGGEGRPQLDGRLRELLRRFDGGELSPSPRRIRIRTSATSAS